MSAVSRPTPSSSPTARLSPTTRRWGRGVAAAAMATTLALGGAGLAHAAPPAQTDQPSGTELLSNLEAEAVPLDSELADAVRKLKAAGVDQAALKAAEAVKNSLGQISPDQITGSFGQLPLGELSTGTAPAAGARQVAADADPLSLLRTAGIQTFSPSVAPFCAAPTDDNPLGLVTAGAGAAPGPWPLKREPTSDINQILQLIPGVKIDPLAPINLVPDGHTGYAFVPAADTTDGKIQVAWFNTTTLQGGFADLNPVGGPQSALLAKLVPGLGGIRLAPVNTGKGTILSAVYGTARNGSQTCFFLPAVGVVDTSMTTTR
ncbi:hypothetical protein ACPXB3_08725 [Gordonia sp. DT219]|uniref:hypothetical protein n=1 Tax=Gordonia sp. DT219 TaxID=3416658 RepID=UPI003CF63B65